MCRRGTGAAGMQQRVSVFIDDLNIPGLPSGKTVRYKDGIDPLARERWARNGGVSVVQLHRFLTDKRRDDEAIASDPEQDALRADTEALQDSSGEEVKEVNLAAEMMKGGTLHEADGA